MSDASRIRTRHAEMTLTQVAEALPGTGEVMRSVSGCFAMSWHAAKGGNWDLGAYYLRRTRSLLRGLAVTRPKYAAQLDEFDAQHLEPIYASMLERRVDQFDVRVAAATSQANRYHVDTGHPYIQWHLPEQPPEQGLDLSAAGEGPAPES